MKLLLPISFALASGLSAAPEHGGSEKPRVYVHVDPRLENQDPDMVSELVDSMADLREQISKRHDIVGAKSMKDADILVTLLDRRIEVNRSGETKYFGYTQTHYQSRYVLSFRLEARGLGLETDAALAGAFVTWKRVAGVVAKDIEEWARDHAESLNGEPSP
ncbi:MAG TPA: hypothetical protein VIE88_04410 [Vicinamibacteria bacterium]|jgi:hypothetical protein